MKSGSSPLPRRQFIRDVSVVAAGVTFQGSLLAAEPGSTKPEAGSEPNAGGIPRRPLGRTNKMLSIIGLGGHTMALATTEDESIRIIHEAVDSGINFLDNAWEYHNGRSESIMGKALKGWRDRVFLMTKMCTHGRNKEVGLRMLEESLKRLQTDRLDLWMIHQLDTQVQVDAAFAPGGSVEALELAKKQGKVRYVGFTGHLSPAVHLAMLKHDYAFDAVLMPVNAFEADRKGFRTQVLPELKKQNIGILGIKCLGGDPAQVLRDGKLTAQQAIRFCLSHPITTQIVGMKSLKNLRDNLEIVRNFKPMPQAEMDALVAQLARANTGGIYTQYRHPDYRDGHGVAA